MNSQELSSRSVPFRAINLACGGKLCQEHGWVNADHSPSTRGVQQINLLRPLPFEDDTFEVVYHSQFIEHLPYDKGLGFMKECHRVLQRGGVMRMVTPDLQNQAREYLRALDAVLAGRGDEAARLRYQWIRLEMLDQLTRHRTGGQMVEFLESSGRRIEGYLWERMGRSGKNLIPQPAGRDKQEALKDALRSLRKLAWGIVDRLTPQALQVGRFRLSGESHLYMYDEYSLSELLAASGFVDIRRVTATQSRIPNWNETRLDCDDLGYPDGAVSLFMEAVKAA